MYMDHLITGAMSVNDVKERYKEAKDIIAEVNMNIREWLFRKEQVDNTISSDDRTDAEMTKVLGLRWNPKKDTRNKTNQTSEGKCFFTKMLKITASIFDLLDLFCPGI